ncbi:hypothetical protein CYR55_22665 [Chimaeribacter californicus]|uniref:Uncharacterized protein n=1 Tax=Chimaeribacter californicus TaxID=2060067 RepID=A0A2N5DTB5_9GAMM|nr:hypothetical protein [Chimaeribacter californicus]PLR29680.1 hypothetical protein CYR55_22665 [Chimaeribacter californicus]
MKDFARAEKIYKQFLEFRQSFLNNALEMAVASDISTEGLKYRPIVIVPPEYLIKFESDIALWEKYAATLDEYPELGTARRLFHPVPKLITGATSVRYFYANAAAQSTILASNVIKSIQISIRQANEYIKEEDARKLALDGLEHDLKIIESLPEGTKLRTRRTGYTDLICQYDTHTERTIPVRASGNGVFFDGTHVTSVNEGASRLNGRISVYDRVEPLPIRFLTGCNVYILSEVEEMKEIMKEEAKERRAEGKVQYRIDQAMKRKAKKEGLAKDKKSAQVKRAAKAPGELNPAGSDHK